MNTQRKIAFSGPSGLGKTTLCKFTQELLGDVPWLSTSSGHILTDDDKIDLHQKYGYNAEGHANVINLSSANPSFGIEFQRLIQKRRTEQISSHERIIIDRSPIDNVVYMLTQVSHNMNENDTKYFIRKAQLAWGLLDEVIIIMYSPDIPYIEDNQSRVPNRYFQQYISSVFRGTYYAFFANIPGPRVLFIDYWDLSERKDKLTKFLKHEDTEADDDEFTIHA